MIAFYEKPFTEAESLESLNHIIRDWFSKKYKQLTPPQRYSFKLIREGRSLLITAPTGSGKTFSAFMAILSDLMDMAEKGELEDKTYCIYISPLRALDNDIFRNLTGPLNEIYNELEKSGKKLKRITIGVRTGDTEQKERQRQLARPPNILVTTPESIAILLNGARFSENLKSVKYVVIDEIHELANNKRGVHLSISLERLANLAGHDFVRVGMGATLYPLENAARFLVGYKPDGSERDCYIIDATWDKPMKYLVISPVKDLVNAKDEQIESAIYKVLDSIIKSNTTTLIFTNTRSGTERVVFNLAKRFHYTEEQLAAHHGSLSREVRLEVEEMLKMGKLKCVVSSTSLELGIDIGSIDNVVQLGSPKSVTRAIQRIGRSGHRFYDVAKGEIVVTNRDDLVECSVMLKAAQERHLDSFSTPKNALDVLAQHVVGMSLIRKWKVQEAYDMIRQAYPYHTLPMKDFESLLEYLSGSYVGLESRRVYGKIWYDANTGEFGKRGRFTKLIYYLNIGTIPDTVAVDVYTLDRKWIGSIEEDFLARLKPGDIFTLGGRLYQFEFSRQLNCYVRPAKSNTPTIPPWFSEQLPLTFELALEIGRFRKEMEEAVRKDLEEAKRKSLFKMLKANSLKVGENARKILDNMPIDENAKNSIFNYFVEQILFSNKVPNDKLVLVEITKEPKSGRRLVVFHSLYGRRVNDTLSRLFGIAISDILETEVGIIVSDNGFVLMLDPDTKIDKGQIDEAFSTVLNEDVMDVLKSNVRRTEMMKRRFRHCAVRGFMVLRNYKGKKISVRKQQVNSEALLSAVEELSPDFPILKETYREILEDVMDLPRTKELLDAFRKGSLRYEVFSTPLPSPFAHIMITFGEADIVMMKDRRKHLRELRNYVLAKIKKDRK
jgi:ATP-dependent Lhr-like helicase